LFNGPIVPKLIQVMLGPTQGCTGSGEGMPERRHPLFQQEDASPHYFTRIHVNKAHTFICLLTVAVLSENFVRCL